MLEHEDVGRPTHTTIDTENRDIYISMTGRKCPECDADEICVKNETSRRVSVTVLGQYYYVDFPLKFDRSVRDCDVEPLGSTVVGCLGACGSVAYYSFSIIGISGLM